jgi:hypothetical protein
VSSRHAPWPPLPSRREVQHGLATALAAWQGHPPAPQSPPAAPAPRAGARLGPAPDTTRATLEAYAATLLPRDGNDAGAPGPRAAGAVALLREPEAPPAPYLPALAALLDGCASAYTARTGAMPAATTAPPFAALAPGQRTALCAEMLAPGGLDETEQQLLTLLSLLVHTASHRVGPASATAA